MPSFDITSEADLVALKNAVDVAGRHIELQVAVLFAMQKNFFDPIDPRKVVAAATSLKDFFASRKDALLTEIRTKAALDKDLEAKLQAACDEWKPTFTA